MPSTPPADLIERILKSLAFCRPAPTSPHQAAASSQETESLLLTLHVLLPHILLDALDLIDRNLITRLTVPSLSAPEGSGSALPSSTASSAVFYHVLSARPIHPTRGIDETLAASAAAADAERDRQNYHVYLDAWYCPCPSFAVSAFSVPQRLGDEGRTDRDDGSPSPGHARAQISMRDGTASKGEGSVGFRFGGWAGGEGKIEGSGMPPVCKHLLACALMECGEGLFTIAEGRDRIVDVQEAVGWAAAGWYA